MRILVGVEPDLPGVDGLIDRAVAYAARLGGRLDLAHYRGASLPTPGEPSRLDALGERIPAELRGERLSDPREPAEGLVEESTRYDLIVVGAREMGALERLVHGSSTAHVLAHSRCPVLVPHAREALQRVPRVLVGVDLESPAPGQVLAWADRWATGLGATLDVVAAVSTHDGEWFARRDALQAQLDALVAARVDGARRGSVEVRRGVAEDVLVTASADHDLVVVGNRERHGLARIVLGSVAAGVVRRSGCDILCVPTVTG